VALLSGEGGFHQVTVEVGGHPEVAEIVAGAIAVARLEHWARASPPVGQ